MKYRGISLIVLVITIILIIILASVIILSLNSSGIINNSKKAVFQANIKEYKSALDMYISNKKLEATGDFNEATLELSPYISGNVKGTIKEAIPQITSDYAKTLQVISGKLIYVGLKDEEVEWCNEVGIKVQMLEISEDGKTMIGVKDLAELYGTLEIPAYITSIRPDAFYNRNIEHVIFSENSQVTEIPANMFKGCNNLKSIKLPNNLKRIGDSAFMSCSNLNNVDIPDSVEYIGSYAFYYCRKLSNIKLPNNINFKTITSSMLVGCNLSNIIIPSTVTTINSGAFSANPIT